LRKTKAGLGYPGEGFGPTTKGLFVNGLFHEANATKHS
jgi:hypothetical protein